LLHYNKVPVTSVTVRSLDQWPPHRRSLTLSSVLSLSFLPIPIILPKTLLDDRLNIGFMLTPLRLLFSMPLPPDGVLGFSFSSFFLPKPRPPNADAEGELPLPTAGELEEFGVGEVDDCCCWYNKAEPRDAGALLGTDPVVDDS
jgi:hypothetical protein